MKITDFPAKMLVNRIKRYGAEDRITVLSYPGVGHFIDTPYAPKTSVHYNSLWKNVIACCANKEHNAAACIHSFKEIVLLFKEKCRRS